MNITKACMLIICCYAIITSCTVPNDKPTVIAYRIYPSLTISNNTIDSIMICAISDVDFLNDGSIAILDRSSAQAYVFSQQGQYLNSIGTFGNGPGELYSPDCLVPLDDDSLLIFDSSAQRISLYRNNGAYIESVNVTNVSQFPKWCKYAGNNNVIGSILLNHSDAMTEYYYAVCRFNRNMQIIDTLFTNNTQVDFTDITTTLNTTVYSTAFTCDTTGNVMVSPISCSARAVDLITSNGLLSHIISEEIPECRKSEQDLNAERERMNLVLQSRNNRAVMEYEPCECYYAITPQGLHADNQTRIWILDGTHRHPIFRVYDYSGNLLFTVEICGLSESDTVDVLWWCISDYGILAFSIDPVNEPEVFVFKHDQY